MLKFEIPKGSKQNLFCLFLHAKSLDYKTKDNKDNKDTVIFSVKPPHFSQDEVCLNMFYNELLKA